MGGLPGFLSTSSTHRKHGWAKEGSHPVLHHVQQCRAGTQGRGQVGALPCPLWLMSFPSTAFLIML